MHLRICVFACLVVCGLASSFFLTASAVGIGQPRMKGQFSTVQGSDITAVEVEVPLLFDVDESQELSVLVEGFVCPGLADPSVCSVSPACECDFASIPSPSACVSELPACCEASYPAAWSSACDPATSPSSWVVLNPDESQVLVVPPVRGKEVNTPLYLRYHPSSEASCRGFGLSLLAPFEELGEALSLETEIYYYVSWTNARPETDPLAMVIRAVPGESHNCGRPRFCPSDRADALQSNGWFGESNTRTAFIAMYANAFTYLNQAVDGYVLLTLKETPDVTDITVTTLTNVGATLPAVPLADRTTYLINASPSVASGYFYYQHPINSPCQQLIVDIHCTSGTPRPQLYGSFSPPPLINWLTHGFIAVASLAFNVCPGETIYIRGVFFASTLTPTTSTTALLTTYLNPPVDLLPLNELNPNLIGTVLSGARAARLICDANTLVLLLGSAYAAGNGRYMSVCDGSYVGALTPACGQFYPISNRENASMLWPAPPTSILTDTYSALNFKQLSAGIGAPLSPNLRFAIVLQQEIFQSKYFGSRAGWIFLTWDQLSRCNLEFDGSLVTGDGRRVFGNSSWLGLPTEQEHLCTPPEVRSARQQLKQQSKAIQSNDFYTLPTSQQRTDLFQQAQTSLLTAFSPCEYAIKVEYQTTHIPGNCSVADPCCPLAEQYIRYFYNYCPLEAYTAIESTINVDVIEEQGGSYECTEALVHEVAQSQAFVSLVPESASKVPCSLGQQDIDILQKSLLAYYQTCRKTYIGPFDKGLPCSSTADCPAHPNIVCLPVTGVAPTGNLYSSTGKRRNKTCQAPTAVWDSLIFDCLVDTMPVLVRNTLAQTLNISISTDDDEFRAALLDYLTEDGCTSVDPSSPKKFAATVSLKVLSDDPTGVSTNTCTNQGTCPWPITCLDTMCPLSQGCTVPWNCRSLWSSFTHATEQSDCETSYRCNVVTASGPVTCSSTNEQDCLSECQAEFGATGFCGYCDTVTGYCYVATDELGNTLSEQQCSTQPADQTCFVQELAVLKSSPCNGRGACTHFNDAVSGAQLMQETDCNQAPSLCLTKERTVMFPPQGGCLGAIRVAGIGCATAQMTDAGCLYSKTVYADSTTCLNSVDPLLSTSKMKGWVEPVNTREACEQQTSMYVCQLPFNDTSPFSTKPILNSQPLCSFRGGDYRSSYTWEPPTFNAGEIVPLSWINVQAVSSGSWSQRINFNRFSGVIRQTITQVQTYVDVLTSVCAYTNVMSLAMQASVCQNVTEPEPGDGCRFVYHTTSSQTPEQQLGSTLVCDNNAINDNITYPSSLTIPPVSLTLDDRSDLHGHGPPVLPECMSISAQLRSNAKFLPSRRRIRETSFFLTRQDTFIPPLSALSSKMAPNGYLLSDAVQLRQDSGSGAHVSHVKMCITPRYDFLAKVDSLLHSNHSEHSPPYYLGFGGYERWRVVPLTSPRSSVSVSYLTQDGELINVAGAKLTGNQSITTLISVCLEISDLELDPNDASWYVAVLTFNDDPEDTSNGFNTAETVWLYITAAAYLAPVLVLWLPSVLRHWRNPFIVPVLASTFLSLFLIFRATLLFCLASNAIAPSSTTEFALTDVAVWCEFAAVCLLAVAITTAVAASHHLRKTKGFADSTRQQALFIVLILLLLALFVGFLIGYSQCGDGSSGITDPTTSCEGRLPAGEQLWTTRRILRFTYEVVLAVFAFLLGIWLLWVVWAVSAKVGRTQTRVRRLAGATSMLALTTLSHAIIALILIGTEWTNFIFGIIMLYVTELIPVTIFFLLSFWKNITALRSTSRSKTHTSADSSMASARNNGSSTAIP